MDLLELSIKQQNIDFLGDEYVCLVIAVYKRISRFFCLQSLQKDLMNITNHFLRYDSHVPLIRAWIYLGWFPLGFDIQAQVIQVRLELVGCPSLERIKVPQEFLKLKIDVTKNTLTRDDKSTSAY